MEDLNTWRLFTTVSTVKYPMSLTDYYAERIVKNVHAIEKEYARLEETPVLYPNDGARIEFQAAFLGTIHCLNSQEYLYKLLNDAEQRSYDFLSQLRSAKSRPAFDKQRKPWQQFLHHGAPGSGISIAPPAIGSIQILPCPGIRILDAWRIDYLRAARDLGRVSNLLYNQIFIRNHKQSIYWTSDNLLSTGAFLQDGNSSKLNHNL